MGRVTHVTLVEHCSKACASNNESFFAGGELMGLTEMSEFEQIGRPRNMHCRGEGGGGIVKEHEEAS